MDLLEFKASVGRALINIGNNRANKRGRLRSATPPESILKKRIPNHHTPTETRKDGLGHWPILTDIKNARRCHSACSICINQSKLFNPFPPTRCIRSRRAFSANLFHIRFKMNLVESDRVRNAKRNLFNEDVITSEENTYLESPAPSLPPEVEDMFSSDDSVWDRDYHPDSPNYNIQDDFSSDSSIDNNNIASKQDKRQQLAEDDVDISIASPKLSNNQSTIRKSKKRVRNPDGWSRNVKKRQREHGLAYKDEKGRMHVPKQCGSRCLKQCTYNCMKNINIPERETIFKNFWTLNDNKKNTFYSKFVRKCSPKRRCVLIFNPEAEEATTSSASEYWLFTFDIKLFS
ncbi:hypothetical protein NQ317_000524 [Molorchus minor]|uniref:PiggyBac transposable element-derived protein domain-containing protein n=1 Tax=Molorchus minor TaxID=1323400 RepID=A0ABQ9J997_9CUCU|nr:hypothetical protein NQ317_000524 [Molorchus minor]